MNGVVKACKHRWASLPHEVRYVLVWVIAAATVGTLGGALSGLETQLPAILAGGDIR